MSTTAPPLPADLEAGLRRLKLATFRRNAPELLQDAKAQRWAPEVLLRAWLRPRWQPGTPPWPRPVSRRPASQ